MDKKSRHQPSDGTTYPSVSKDAELGWEMLLKVTSWRHENTLRLLGHLQKFYDGDVMRGAPSGKSWTIPELATLGRIRRVHEGVAPGSAPMKGSVGSGASAKEQDWDAARQHGYRPRLLRSRAGMGKTFFSRWAAGRGLEKAIMDVGNFQIDCAEVRFPIWLTAAKLVELPGYTLAECLRAWVLEWSRAARCDNQDLAERLYQDVLNGQPQDVLNDQLRWSVFIDSLDQLRSSEINNFRNLLASGGEFNPCLVLTSRPDVNFTHFFPEDFPACDILELLPFNKTEQAQYLWRYKEALAAPIAEAQNLTLDRGTPAEIFPAQAALGQLWSDLDKDADWREVASTPLMLRFLCDLAANGKIIGSHSRNAAGSRSKDTVYRFILDSLLEGRWLQHQQGSAAIPKGHQEQEDLRLRTCLMSAMLFSRNPEAGVFSLQSWYQAWKDAEGEAEKLMQGTEPGQLLDAWVRFGLIESEASLDHLVGSEGPSVQKTSEPHPQSVRGDRYVFRHRSLLEYLTAECLADLDLNLWEISPGNPGDPKLPGWKEKVKSRLGFVDGEFYACHPAWTQTLDFLAGQPQGPGQKSRAEELIELVQEIVDEVSDDLAQPLVALQVRWAALSRADFRDETIRPRLAETIVDSGIGAGVSDPEKLIPPSHALARGIYQDLARDPVMTKTAVARLESKKSTYGLGLLGLAGAEAIKAILESSMESGSRLPRTQGKRTRDISGDRLGYLIDLARTGDDEAVVEWTKNFQPGSGQVPPGDEAVASATEQNLVRSLLVCGGSKSFEFLQDLLKRCRWEPQAFQVGLEGPNADTLSRCIFEGIGSESLLPGLVGINLPDYDEKLEQIWTGADDNVGMPGSPIADETRRRAGRVLLLRRSPPSHSIIKDILGGDSATIDRLAGRNLSANDPELVRLLVIAIRAAAEAGLAQVRIPVKAAAARMDSFQVRYAATVFLCELGNRDDLPALRGWVNDEKTFAMADCRERLALKLKAIEAHLRAAVQKPGVTEVHRANPAPEAKTFVSTAIVEIVQSGDGWRDLRIEETPEGVRIPDSSEPNAGAKGAFARALRLVANWQPTLGQEILKETVVPMFFPWRAIRSLTGTSHPKAGAAPWIPLHPIVRLDAWREVCLARAIIKRKVDRPRLLRRDPQLLVEYGDESCFDDAREQHMNAAGGIAFKATVELERLLSMARRLNRRVTWEMPAAARTPKGRSHLRILWIFMWTFAVAGFWTMSAITRGYYLGAMRWEIFLVTPLIMLSWTFVGALALSVLRSWRQSAIRRDPRFSRRRRVISLMRYLCSVWLSTVILLPAVILLPEMIRRLGGAVGSEWMAPSLLESALPVLGILAIFDLDRCFCVSFARSIPKGKRRGIVGQEMILYRALVYAAILEFETWQIIQVWDPGDSPRGGRYFYLLHEPSLVIIFFLLAAVVWFFATLCVARFDPGHKSVHSD